MQAQEQIHKGLLDPLNPAQAYDVTLLAYGDEDRARKAQSEAAKRYADYKVATGPKR